MPLNATVTLRGDEVVEAMFFADPAFQQKDLLLLRAKQVAKYAKATHFSNSELRAVSWFAHLPGFLGDLTPVVFDEGNFLASCFWSAWRRDPETVLRLAARILNPPREHSDVEDVISNPKEFSSSSDPTLKKAVQRARHKLAPSENVAKFAAHLKKLEGQKTQ